MDTIYKKRIMVSLLLITIFLLIAPLSSQAVIHGITGPTFNLTAKSGTILADDGKSIFMWGFAKQSTRVQMQYPGPTLIVNQGETVTVNLTNQLPVPVSIVFPGQVNVSAVGGVPGLLTNEALPGASVTYTFNAAEPGTYTYYSGTRPEIQIEMGLFGALIIRPSAITPPPGYAGCAYNHTDSCFHREYIQVLSEIDHRIHESVSLGQMDFIDNTEAYAFYWFINGRAGFDTIADNFVPYLRSQPYNAIARLHPGEHVLVRMIGAGRDLHPHHLHGNHHRVIARDGRLLKGSGGQDLSEYAFTSSVAPGQTTDALFTWTGEGLGWDIYGHALGDPLAPGECPGGISDPACDHGKPIPVDLPNLDDLTFGPFFSGSPFLGTGGTLPPGEGGFNPNSGLFFMWHSHNEKEITTNNIFPGGMLTFGVVEHPSVPIP
jgi:FtsP/CotA-like multicopper oxidase with cupredoxin domain